MKNKIIALIVVFIFSAFAISWYVFHRQKEMCRYQADEKTLTWVCPQSLPSENPDHHFLSLKIHDAVLHVEVVSTPGGLAHGLSDRKELGSDGMLFILPQEQIATFWMKDMLFDLDFVWIDQWKVTNVLPNISRPAPGTPDHQLTVYSSQVPVTEVLEVTAGTAQKDGIFPGDKVEVLP